MSKKYSKEDLIYKELIDKMFEIAGHKVTYEDIVYRKDDWFMQWSMTEDQQAEWIKWGEAYIKKKNRYSAPAAKKAMGFFAMNYGLTIKH